MRDISEEKSTHVIQSIPRARAKQHHYIHFRLVWDISEAEFTNQPYVLSQNSRVYVFLDRVVDKENDIVIDVQETILELLNTNNPLWKSCDYYELYPSSIGKLHHKGCPGCKHKPGFDGRYLNGCKGCRNLI